MNKYTIIIPVFGALEHVKKCIDSVLRNTPKEHRILVIDDCSREGDVIRYLQDFTWSERMIVTFHSKNLGFVKTANEGIREALATGTEPILLNSDTIVPPRWVERIDEARAQGTERGVRVGAISPLSNNASHYSVPNAYDNDLPDWLDPEAMDHIVEETSGESFPEIPCAVGFCMMLTREALEAVGSFDPKWGKGYGEETDWSVRAKAAGFSCILADNLFVWHEHHASFGWRARKLREEHQAMFLEQYPGFDKVVDNWCLEGKQTQHRVSIAIRLWQRRTGNRKRVLFVCHHWGKLGGLEVFQRLLVKELCESLDVVVMYPTREAALESSTHVGEFGELHIVMAPHLVQSQIDLGIFPFQLRAEHVEKWFCDCLESLAPEVVHFQHLGGFGTFRLPEIARAYCPTVLSVHDDFYLCPSYLTAGWSCGRDAAEDCQQCRECVEQEWTVRVEGRHSDSFPMLLERRPLEVGSMLGYVDRIVFPSESLRERYERNVSCHRIDGAKLQTVLIPHGVPSYPFADTYRPTDRVRVAWVGGVLPEKGWDAFADAARVLKYDNRFEFSVLGEWVEFADRSKLEHVRFHGRYSPEELPQLLQSVDVAVPAVARKEAYGMAVDECLAAGCPVMVASVPTMRERLDDVVVGVGWYQWGNASSLACELGALRPPSSRIVVSWTGSTMHECALNYCLLYEELTATVEAP